MEGRFGVLFKEGRGEWELLYWVAQAETREASWKKAERSAQDLLASEQRTSKGCQAALILEEDYDAGRMQRAKRVKTPTS